MPRYRVQFIETITYDVVFDTPTHLVLNDDGYPESEDEWFSAMDDAGPGWYRDYMVGITDRELTHPIRRVPRAEHKEATT